MSETKNPSTRGASPGLRLLRRVAVVLALVVLLGAGMGTLAGFAARHSWRLDLASHFRVQYFWALLGAFVVLALARHKWPALVAFALALTNLVLIVPLYFGPAPRAQGGPPLRAMSLNVNFRNQNHGATLELILEELPDVVLLLEVTPAWAEALEFLTPEYPYQHVIDYEQSSGLAFYSRHPITEARVHESTSAGLPTIVLELATPAGEVTFVGTHPVSPGSLAGFDLRNSQLEQVGQLARGLKGAVILLGDLNTTSWSPFFRDFVAESGLRDSRRGFGVEASWPWYPGAVLRIPIDHCLVSESVSVLRRWIGPAVGSDHRPIFVEFAVGEP